MISRAFLTALALLIASCGFRPLYVSPTGGDAIGPVQIAMVEGRAGHGLRAELGRLLAVEHDGPSSLLEIELQERVNRFGYRLDSSATRAELRVTANYVLTTAMNGRIRGSVSTVVTYDIPRSSFAEIAAQDDARDRAAEVLAQRLRADLALRLARLRS